MNTKKITFSFLMCAITCYTSQNMSMRRAFLYTARNIQTMRSTAQQGYATTVLHDNVKQQTTQLQQELDSLEYQAAKLKEIEARKAVLDSMPLQDKVLMAAGASAEFATKASIAKDKLKCAATGTATANHNVNIHNVDIYSVIRNVQKTVQEVTPTINQIEYDRTLLKRLNNILEQKWLANGSIESIISEAKELRPKWDTLNNKVNNTSNIIQNASASVDMLLKKNQELKGSPKDWAEGTTLFCISPLGWICLLGLTENLHDDFFGTAAFLASPFLLSGYCISKYLSSPYRFSKQEIKALLHKKKELNNVKMDLSKKTIENEYCRAVHLFNQILNKEIKPKS